MGDRQRGFSIIEVVLVMAVIGVVGAAGWFVYQHSRAKVTNVMTGGNQTISRGSNQKQNTTDTGKTDPYEGWQAFTDNASSGSSGISIKYPSGWQVKIGGSKVYAWSITSATAGIAARYIFTANSWTARQEWQTCATQFSADACGAAPGDTTISGNESTISGLDAYTATMRSSNGSTYHVTVIRGNKAADGVPFVEFTTYATDQAVLNIYEAVMASATFPN